MSEKTFIHSIFIDPPIAIARLGGSPIPQDAYGWAEPDNPRTEGNTVIVPAWSLNILPDASVEPVMPTEIKLRDGALIRPVCPFFEVWALVSAGPEDPPRDWEETPLTIGLLRANRVTNSAIRLRVEAMNRKAARRTGKTELVFGTFPPVSIRGDRHATAELRGTSSPHVPAGRRMIPGGKHIPLGSVRIMRPKDQPAAPTSWSEADIRLDVIRFRFTPARGEFYGPPAAARTSPPAVTPGTHDFLRAGAGWLHSLRDARPARLRVMDPPDTIDEDQQRSLGVVDDTCEARLEVVLSLPRRGALSASARAFVAPPDFAPDRRPFLSVADELNDRVGGAAGRTALMDSAQREAWIEDLFERISETVALFNVDAYRSQNAVVLRGDRLLPKPGILGDHLPEPSQAMGGRDKLRSQDLGAVGRADPERPLPLSERARERHGELANINGLRDLLAAHPDRLTELVRGPFEVERVETAAETTTMRMPPFMANSNAYALTLSAWQHELLMDWVREIKSAAPLPAEAAAPRPRAMPAFAAKRRAAVLARLERPPTP